MLTDKGVISSITVPTGFLTKLTINPHFPRVKLIIESRPPTAGKAVSDFICSD
jgi:hypothetical protein